MNAVRRRSRCLRKTFNWNRSTQYECACVTTSANQKRPANNVKPIRTLPSLSRQEMEQLRFSHCCLPASRRNMRRHILFWCISYIVLCTRDPSSSRPVLVVGYVITNLTGAMILPLLLQQGGHKWLLSTCAHSAEQNSQQTDVTRRRKHSRNCSRNTSCYRRSRSRGTTAESSYANNPDVSKDSSGTRDGGSPSFTVLRSGSTRLNPAWKNFKSAWAPHLYAARGEHSDEYSGVPYRFLQRPRRFFEALVSKLPQTASQPQPQLELQPQMLPERRVIRRQSAHIFRKPSFTSDHAVAAPAASSIEIFGMEEASCQLAQQTIIAIDGGSSKTLPSLFSVLTESCVEGKHSGRHVLVDTLRFVGDGDNFLGVRQLLEKWLNGVVREKPEEPKQLAAIADYQKNLLQRGFPFLEQAVEELVSKILENMVQLIETTMSELEQHEAKALGVPVIFHSTAGLRDFPSWYREGLFIALRRAINSAPSVRGFVFFTNPDFARPISGQFEAVCAFLTANYLLGNLGKLRDRQRAEERRDARDLSAKAFQHRDDTLRQVRRKAVSFSLEPELPEKSGVRRSLRSGSPGSTTAGEDSSEETSVYQLACGDLGCSLASPFSPEMPINRCRSGIPDIRFCAHEYLAAVIESGGASLQIAFPIRRLDLLPVDTSVYNLQRGGFLSEDYPPLNVVAISFMQLGSNSAGGLFLKLLCAAGSPFVSGDKTCVNPCFHKNYTQPCSAGEVVISDKGDITVLEDTLHNRLRPAAVFCGEDNPQVLVKTSTEVECRASNFDPLMPLRRRLEIPNCKRIVGSGDFDKCVEAVTHFLIQPEFPLPANQEAVAAGFENPSQIFNFFSSRAPLMITGNSLVIPMRTLQTAGFLREGDLIFAEEDLGRIEQASREYCVIPIVKDYTGTLRLRRNGRLRKSDLGTNEIPNASITDATGQVPRLAAVTTAAYAQQVERSIPTGRHGAEEEDVEDVGEGEGLKIDSLNYENCQRLATIVALLRSIYKGAEGPSHVLFTTELKMGIPGSERRNQQGKQRQEPVGKLGWQIGTILRHMSNEAGWRKLVYELGAAHSLHDRLRRGNQRWTETGDR